MLELYQHFSQTAERLSKRGWSECHAGNISLRLDSKWRLPGNWGPRAFPLPIEVPALSGQQLIFTATGSRMHAIAKAPSSHLLILEIDGSGTQGLIFQQPIERQLMPTSELSTHLAVHALLLAERPGQQALIHAHVTPLITLSHYPTIEDEESLNDILLRVHPETLYFLPAGAGLVPFSLPGSADLGFKTAQRFIRHDVVLWERHGALACGADLEQAFDRLEIAAKAASIFLDCKKAGFSLKTFDENEMNILRAHYAAMSKDQSN